MEGAVQQCVCGLITVRLVWKASVYPFCRCLGNALLGLLTLISSTELLCPQASSSSLINCFSRFLRCRLNANSAQTRTAISLTSLPASCIKQQPDYLSPFIHASPSHSSLLILLSAQLNCESLCISFLLSKSTDQPKFPTATFLLRLNFLLVIWKATAKLRHTVLRWVIQILPRAAWEEKEAEFS